MREKNQWRIGASRNTSSASAEAERAARKAEDHDRAAAVAAAAAWTARDQLAELPAAIRTRVIRRAALDCGAPAEALGYDHVRRLEDLVVRWHGQGEIRLPGGVTAERACGRLCLHPA